MSVVVDANLVAALLIRLPYSQEARDKLCGWREAREELVAPTLLEYEVCSTLHRAVRAGWIAAEKVPQLLVQMRRLAIRLVSPTLDLHRAALQWAQRLGRSRTYDAQYMAVAEEFRADFWTGDIALFNRARQLGVTWVHSIAAEPSPPA